MDKYVSIKLDLNSRKELAAQLLEPSRYGRYG